MSITYRRLAATVLVAAVVSGACSDGGDDKKKKKAAPAGGQVPVKIKVGGVHSPAAGLRAQLTRLLQEHVFLSGIATDLVLQGKDTAPVGAVLEANTTALGTTFSQVYDDLVAQRLVELWRQKSALVTQFAQATAVGDQTAAASAKAALEQYKVQFATFVNETNPQLAADLLEDRTGTHVNSLLSVVTAQSKKDPLALSKLRDAAKVMPRTGAIFAAGIVKQMPEAFEGTADGSGATLLATLTAALQEHVYLLGATTRTAVAGGDLKKPQETLDETSEGLANLVSSLYGDPAGRRFLQVWRSHIGAFVDYARAAAAKDGAGVQKATADLVAFRGRLGALFEDLNKNLPSQAVAADFEDYVAAMQAALAAQAVADPAEFQLLHEAAGTTPLLAEVLAGAIARQFDSKFS